MKRISFLVLALGMIVFQGNSQDLDLTALDEQEFSTIEDYEDFEEEVLSCIEWLNSHSVDHPDRKTVNAIVLKWLTGTSSVSITLNEYVSDFSGKNPDLLMIFMGGWTEYVLDIGKSNASDLESNIRGLEAVINYYEKRKEYNLSKDAGVQRLVKLRDQGALRNYVMEKL